MRVIIRFSLNGSNRPAVRLRASLKRQLEAQGIHWTGKTKTPYTTSTYEGDVGEKAIRIALRDFWFEAENFTGNAHIDHFWMYADRHPSTLKA